MKKGFTLIELLAVILILGIIALIAIPVVNNIINESKKGAAKAGAYNYIEAIERNNALADMSSNYTKITPGNIEDINSSVNVKGTKPTSGTITISDNDVTNATFCINEYNVTYDGDKVTVGSKCNGGNASASSKVCTLKSGNALAIGSEYDCTVASGVTKTFYVLEVTSDKVSLIMNQNIDNTTVAYCDPNGSNPTNAQLCQGDGAKTKLPTTWTNVEKVSLPTGQQIANAVNNKTWTAGSTNISISTAPWLYDYISGRPHSIENVYGYWTSTPYTNLTTNTWNVNYDSELRSYNVTNVARFGVRPVITISKSAI